jgi:hypothetical protein
MKRMMAVAAFALFALAGCERYQSMGEADGRLVVQDRLTGKLYSVAGSGGNGYLHELSN